MTKKFLLFTSMFCLANLSFAETKSNCSNINQNVYPDEYRTCIRLQLTERANEAGVDCVDCFVNEEENKQPSSWVQALSVLAQPLAYLGSAYVTAKYQYKTQQAWADAYSSGYQQCTNRFNSYLDYSTSSGANPITSSEASTLMNSCNGNSYSAYSGFGGYSANGYGGYSNPWLGSGYSSGFMSGMIGQNYGSGYSANYGMGLGSMYSGMNTGLYGSAGYGIYGNIGMGTSPYMMNYSSGYGSYGGTGMYYGGMGINSLNSGSSYTFGSSPYAAGNLTSSIGLSGTGYAF